MQEDFAQTLRFWLARGVDGFRVDVAGGLAKDPSYGEVRRGVGAPALGPRRGARHLPLRGAACSGMLPRSPRPGDRPSARPRSRVPDELGQAFAFDILRTPWSAAALRRTVDAQLAAHRAVGALPAWVAGNHDIARVATRLGPQRALALHLFLLALPGAFYLYAGDELGLPDADVPPEPWQDPQSLRSGGRLPNRDGARVPLPWTSGAGRRLHDGHPVAADPARPGRGYARDAQEADPTSTWSVLHRALAARTALWTTDDLTWQDARPGVLVGRRGDAPWCSTRPRGRGGSRATPPSSCAADRATTRASSSRRSASG